MNQQPQFIRVPEPDEWRKRLAQPDKQWETGFSARTLAYCWYTAQGFPPEVSAIFERSLFPEFHSLEPLLILPEHKVPLPGGSRGSQNDVFVLAKTNDGQLVSIMVEGKVNEEFDKTLGKWKLFRRGFTENKRRRLRYLQEQLSLNNIPDEIYYQLIHRSASALIEAQCFGAKYAIMLVHSFGQQGKGFNEYADFIRLFDQAAKKDTLHYLNSVGDRQFFSAWVTGDARFLMS